MKLLWPLDEFTDEATCRRHASACQGKSTKPVGSSEGPAGRGLSGTAALLSHLARATAIPCARRLAAVPDRLPQSSFIINQRFLNAVSCAYTFSVQLKDAYCHIAAYKNHVNLGFNRGAELHDPNSLLCGSGKLIRHIPIRNESEIATPGYSDLVQLAVAEGRKAAKPGSVSGQSLLQSRSTRRKRPSLM